MPSSLFGAGTSTISPTISQGTAIPITISNDAVTVVENAIKQSGGDPQTAFYNLAKEKGVDGDKFLNDLSSMNTGPGIVQKLLSSNPRISRLMSLVSLFK